MSAGLILLALVSGDAHAWSHTTTNASANSWAYTATYTTTNACAYPSAHPGTKFSTKRRAMHL